MTSPSGRVGSDPGAESGVDSAPGVGSVVGVTTVVDNGPPDRRFDIVVLAEGYRLERLPIFADRVKAFAGLLFAAAPFDVLRGAINIHRIDVVSGDRGYFGAARGAGRAVRLLTVDCDKALAVASRHVAAYDMVLVQVDDERYGGSGGAVATFSAHPAAAEIALHEMGHTAFGLGDEYDGSSGSDAPDGAGGVPAGSRAAGHDADYPNIARSPRRELLPWAGLVAARTPLPTGLDAAPETVGAFEGADYRPLGAYRPQRDCRMRTLGQPFCLVCQQAIRRQVLRYVTNAG